MLLHVRLMGRQRSKLALHTKDVAVCVCVCVCVSVWDCLQVKNTPEIGFLSHLYDNP